MRNAGFCDDLDIRFTDWLAPAGGHPANSTIEQNAPATERAPGSLPENDIESIPDSARAWFVNGKPVITAASRGDVRFFVNGKDYCSDLHRQLGAAQRHVYLTGLHFMHDFKLIRTSTQGRNRTLGEALLALARRDIKIYLLVNLFWISEANTIGRWRRSGQFVFFNPPRQRDSFDDESRRRSELSDTINELSTAWPASTAAERFVRAIIGAKGLLERYFPATVDLFRVLQHRNIKCRLDVHPGHIMHSHHQKTVVVDDRVSFVGGIDLTHIDGDRWDTSAHSANHRKTNKPEKYWHDIHGRIDGHGARIVAENFKDRWRNGDLYAISSATLTARARRIRLVRDTAHSREFGPAPRPSGGSPHRPYRIADIRNFTRPMLQFVRSMPAARGYSVPSGQWERTAKDAYLTGITAARRSIYLENQWIADEHIWAALTRGAAANQRLDYQVVLMMPNEPLRAAGAGANQDIFVELNLLQLLRAGYSSRTVSVFSLVNPRDNMEIYVHSKIMTVDDVWSLIGSANAGGISLEGVRDLPTLLRICKQFGLSGRLTRAQIAEILRVLGGSGDRPDTELSFITLDPAFANDLRTSIWHEHLTDSGRALTGDLRRDIDTLRTAANENRHRLRNHPYLVTAFKTSSFRGIDLRVFGYGDGDLIRLLGRSSRNASRIFQRIYQQLRKLSPLLTSLQAELQPYDAALQRSYRVTFSSAVAPYLQSLMSAAPSQAQRIRPLLELVQRFGGSSRIPNV